MSFVLTKKYSKLGYIIYPLHFHVKKFIWPRKVIAPAFCANSLGHISLYSLLLDHATTQTCEYFINYVSPSPRLQDPRERPSGCKLHDPRNSHPAHCAFRKERRRKDDAHAQYGAMGLCLTEAFREDSVGQNK